MFVLNSADTAKVKVAFKYPSNGSVGKKQVDFVAEFEIKNSEIHKQRRDEGNQHNLQVAQATKRAIEGSGEPDYPDLDLDEKYCREDLVGLDGIFSDESKNNAIEFSEELVDKIFLDRYARAALIAAWIEFCESPEAAKRKN